MNLDEIQQAIGGSTAVPHQPEGGSDVQPLTGHHLAKPDAEPAPADIEPQQGAGSPGGSLTPGATGSAGDGTVEAGNDDHYADQGGPEQLSAVSGLAGLTPGYDARPEGGAVAPGEQSGGADPRLGADGSGQQPGHPLLKVHKQ